MTMKLPDWLSRRIVGTEFVQGESAVGKLDANWPWTPSLTVLFVVLAIVSVVYFYSRESSSASRWYRSILALLRLGVIALLLFMLTQLVITWKRTGPPAIAVLIDRSSSMAVADYNNGPVDQQLSQPNVSLDGVPLTRLDVAKSLISANDFFLLRHLTAKYELNVYFFDQQIQRQTSDKVQLVERIAEMATDRQEARDTRLGDAVRQALRDAPGGSLAAVIVLTDGVNTAGSTLQSAAQLARRQGVPLFTVGLGSDRPPRDIQLADALVEEAVFVDDLVSFRATIKATGLAGEQARVVLRRESDGAVLAEDNIQLSDRDVVAVQLTHRPSAPGNVSYTMEVEPHEHEIDTENNRSRHTVVVHDQRIRVLLAQAYPSFEFRYLKTLFDRESTVQLATFLQEADADYVAQDATAVRSFPIGQEALLEYDVVLLGDVDPRLLPRSIWPNLLSMVEEQGGGVAFLAGPRYLPWLYHDIPEAKILLPVEISSLPATDFNEVSSSGFAVAPTPIGWRSAALQLGDSVGATREIWRNLPPLYWLAVAGEAKPATRVLAQHPTRTGASGRQLPLICLQYVGNGRVLYHAIDSTWRWRMRAGDVFFARYWVQMVRFLARAKLHRQQGAELTVDRRVYQRGESVEVRLRFFNEGLSPASDDGAEILIETPGQQQRHLTLRRSSTAHGVFRGTLTELAEGDYRVVMVEPAVSGDPPATQFSILAPLGELARVEMNRAALIAAADTTHGKFYTPSDFNTMLGDLPTGRRVTLETLPPWPLWNRPSVVALLTALLISEWVLRRMKGML